jgi:hypothetical protein
MVVKMGRQKTAGDQSFDSTDTQNKMGEGGTGAAQLPKQSL